MPEIVATPRAKRDIGRLDLWWREQRPDAAELFERELAAAFEILKETPDVGMPFRSAKVPGVRRLLLPRTRYHVYYKHDSDDDLVKVLAVWGAIRRRPPRL